MHTYLKILNMKQANQWVISTQAILKTHREPSKRAFFTLTCDLWGPYFLLFIRISSWAVRTPHILSYLFILLGGTSLLYSGEKTEAFCPITWAEVVFDYLLSARLWG